MPLKLLISNSWMMWGTAIFTIQSKVWKRGELYARITGIFRESLRVRDGLCRRIGKRQLLTVNVDSRAEYLAPGSNGLMQTLNRSNELFASVRQTSDATLDSRLLVSTADLSAKRTTLLNLGDSTTGIDVDDFVGKCITFMRRGGNEGAPSTQRRRRVQDDSDVEATGEGYDEGDAFDWELLGRQLCIPNNVRPPVPGFLLGPLSVQKRARKATQRRERLQKRDPADAVRPEEVKAKDLEQAENSNLTNLCRNIRGLLSKVQLEGQEGVEKDIPDFDNVTLEDAAAVLAKYGLADDLGVPLFNFVVNPRSFGQTVENLFYVSFLIRDGVVGVGNDNNMMPTLRKFPVSLNSRRGSADMVLSDATDPRKPNEIQEQNISKHQAVFHLNFETWEDLIDTFDIKKSIIPNRQPDPAAHIDGGWYA